MIHEVQRLSGHIADSVKYIAPNLQAKEVTPTKETIETTYDEGYNGLSTVTINPIPDEFIVPEGSVTITENSITDVTDKKTVEVNVQPILQSKTTTPTKESQIINADNNYYGLSDVTVNPIPDNFIDPNGTKTITDNGNYDVREYNNASVNVSKEAILQEKNITVEPNTTVEVTPDKDYDALSKVVATNTIETEQKSVIPTKETQIITPTEDKFLENVTVEPIPSEYIVPSGELEITSNGIHSVTEYDKANVNVQPLLDVKTVTPTKDTQVITPDNYGLSEVTVNPIPDEYIVPVGEINIIANGAYNVKNYENAKVEIDNSPTLDSKTVTPTKETQTVTSDVDGLSSVTVNPIPDEYIIPNNQSKTITPTKSTQSVIPDTGYDGLSDVTVNPIPSEYIVPSGTKNITTNGTHDITNESSAIVNVQPTLQTKTVTPTKETQTINPDSGFDALSDVTVNAIPSEYIIPQLDSKSVTPTKATQTVTSDVDGLSSVTVNPIPDEYIIPSGIKNITTNGTHDVTSSASATVNVQSTLQTKTVTPTKSVQTVSPDSGYDGLSSVNVSAIPDNYIEPTGTIEITENSTVDVTNYASANVNVGPSKGIVIDEWDSDGYVTVISFVGMTSIPMRALYFGNGTVAGSNMFCANLTTIKLSDEVISIEQLAFSYVTSLSAITLPKNLTSIGNSVFSNCSKLATVDVIGNVKSIGSSVFNTCAALNKLILRNVTQVPTLGSSVFNGTKIYTGTGYIYVPDTLIDSFKAATNWSTLADQIKGLSEL